MVDIHCHILPQTDDGAKSWGLAEEMCRLAAADGITRIVATPHAKLEYPYDRKRHAETLHQLQSKTGSKPLLTLGCELFISPENVESALRNPSDYVIGDSHSILIELSDFGIPPGLLNTFQQFLAAGLRPILAHPERNPFLQRRPEPVLEWVRHGLLVQVTADSLTGSWGRLAQQVARWLLEQNAVHVVASDAHNPRSRPPLLSSARRVLCEWQDAAVAHALVESNPAAILRDAELP
jgi:protein-tyrosine phosphatase